MAYLSHGLFNVYSAIDFMAGGVMPSAILRGKNNMGKRGVIHPVYGITEAAFFGKIRSALRKQWSYSQAYKDALNRAKVAFKGIGRRKFSMRCEQCSIEYALGERIIVGETKQGKPKDALAYQVDHKVDAGTLKTFEDLSGFAERLFCSPEELQVLCWHCHHKKTHVSKKANQ